MSVDSIVLAGLGVVETNAGRTLVHNQKYFAPFGRRSGARHENDAQENTRDKKKGAAVEDARALF